MGNFRKDQDMLNSNNLKTKKMHIRNFKLITILLITNAHHIFAQNINENEVIYSKNFIRGIIEKVNTYQYTHPWTEKDYGWKRGVYYNGVMASYQATGNKNTLTSVMPGVVKTIGMYLKYIQIALQAGQIHLPAAKPGWRATWKTRKSIKFKPPSTILKNQM